MAQDVQKILPQLVNQDDSAGLLRINYQGFIPLLVQCLQEQAARIDQLESDIAACCSNSAAQAAPETPTGHTAQPYIGGFEKRQIYSGTSAKNSTPIQIIPNPNQGTFDVFYPNPIDQIMVTDLSGKQMAGVQISTPSPTQKRVSLQGNRSGVYYIHIIAHGQVVASEQIVVYH